MLKNEDGLKNEDNLKKENNLKKEDHLKNEDHLKKVRSWLCCKKEDRSTQLVEDYLCWIEAKIKIINTFIVCSC